MSHIYATLSKRIFFSEIILNANTIVTYSAVFDKYQELFEKSIEDSIKSELSGDFERLMLAVGKMFTLPPIQTHKHAEQV